MKKKLIFFQDIMIMVLIGTIKQIYKKTSDRMNFCEFSTSYLYSYHAPTRVKINFPNTKILVVLRNPILRTLSHLRHEVLNGRSNFKILRIY